MKRKGFTLIELLIVVAIIAILAAIAVPNFLEAQTRSKVSRVKADMRSLATAIEAYFTDANHYPQGRHNPVFFGHWGIDLVHELTTPIAYMTSVNLIDPFMPDKDIFNQMGYKASFQYFNYDKDGVWGGWMTSLNPSLTPVRAFSLESWGPDQLQQAAAWIVYGPITPSGVHTITLIYDPTNGTRSPGDILRVGGAVPGSVPPVN